MGGANVYAALEVVKSLSIRGRKKYSDNVGSVPASICITVRVTSLIKK
jgi:hypothetical protein